MSELNNKERALLRLAIGVVLASLLIAGGPGLAAQDEDVLVATNGTVQEFSYAGDGSITSRYAQSESHFLWQDREHSFLAQIDRGTWTESNVTVDVCVESTASDDGTTRTIACQRLSSSSSGVDDVTFTVEEWPRNATGQQSVALVVEEVGGTNATVAEENASIVVIREGGDYDGDGLVNRDEIEHGALLDSPDSDDDDLEDGMEVHAFGSDPTKNDTDGDGLTDFVEVNESETDPTAEDSDDDGLTDRQEVNQYDTNPNREDTDGDGLVDGKEIKTYKTSPGNPDSDDDGLSDGEEIDRHETDPNDPDTDGDGLSDGREVTIYDTDPDAADSDDDGLSDSEEVNEYQTNPNDADSDDDGLEDGDEVNEYDTNPNNEDSDSDGTNDGEEVERGRNPAVPNMGSDASRETFVDLGDPLLGASLIGVAALVLAGVAVAVTHRKDRSLDAREDDEPPDGETEDGADDDPPPTILTKEERVLRIVDEHGGRVRQSDIVDETGWSTSKVSRTISKMEANGEVSKITLGRGNLITRPGDEPENANSPFDE